MSLYAEYVSEREGGVTIESNKGFISYKFDGDYVFIIDLFIKQGYRGEGFGTNLVNQVEEIGKDNDKLGVICSASHEALNYQQSVSFIIKTGFKFINGTEEQTFFVKDLQ